MDTFKRSVARDFRIQDQALEAILNEQVLLYIVCI